MTRKRALIATGIATAVTGIVLLAVDPSARDSRYPSIVEFEFAGSEENASEILSDWGERGTDAAKASLWLDYLYIALFAAAAAAFDAIEDVGLLLAVDGHGGDLAPGLAHVCASLKFLLLAAVIAYLLIGLALRLRARRAPA